jgi:hypothetical protein
MQTNMQPPNEDLYIHAHLNGAARRALLITAAETGKNPDTLATEALVSLFGDSSRGIPPGDTPATAPQSNPVVVIEKVKTQGVSLVTVAAIAGITLMLHLAMYQGRPSGGEVRAVKDDRASKEQAAFQVRDDFLVESGPKGPAAKPNAMDALMQAKAPAVPDHDIDTDLKAEAKAQPKP